MNRKIKEYKSERMKRRTKEEERTCNMRKNEEAKN
jgi:hypothetical protein